MEHSTAWKPLPELIEKRETDERRIAETLQKVEAYWDETAFCGGPKFDAGRGMDLLLHDARKYAAALQRIVEKAREQEALIKHREASGQEATDADRQRWFAYLEIAHLAEQGLSHGSPDSPEDNSGPDLSGR
jgi:hypothetical protein